MYQDQEPSELFSGTICFRSIVEGFHYIEIRQKSMSENHFEGNKPVENAEASCQETHPMATLPTFEEATAIG